MREDELATWVSAVVGGGAVRLDRLAQGRSRVTYSARTAAAKTYIVRVDTGEGPLSHTELTLRREAAVYAALQDRGVPIPAFHGISPDGMALLLERATGTSDVDSLAPRARDALYDDYLDHLADLHRLDTRAMDLPGLARPADCAAGTLAELDLWEGVFRRRTTRAWPVVELGFRMLRRLRPHAPAAPVLCHGDVGPKNFMHDGTRVTALIDWEFSHVGDPMGDLAWWVFRGHEWLGGCGDLEPQLRRWSRRSGIEVDLDRLRFHRALVVLMWLVIIAAALDNPTVVLERAVYLALVSVTSMQLVRALADLDGLALSAAQKPPSGPAGPAHEALVAFQEDVDNVVRPAVDDPQAGLRLQLSSHYFAHLLAADSVGARLRDADLADLSALAGRRIDDIDDGHRTLAALIRDGHDHESDTVEALWRSAQRATHLWPLTRAKATAAPHELLGRGIPVGSSTRN
jgi:aminoglycoside phosphotransferase (APT) family kinase protein